MFAPDVLTHADLFGQDAVALMPPPPSLGVTAQDNSAFASMLAFWDRPGEVLPSGVPLVGPTAEPSEEAADTSACRSTISGRTRGKKQAIVTMARGARFMRLRMSEVKSTETLTAGRRVDLGEGPLGVLEVGRWDDGESVLPPDKKRGTITGFSFRSRGRLLDLINSIDQQQSPSERWRFVTLTYHQQNVSPAASKAHLRAMLKRIDRHFGRTGCIWKIEPQKRGMPHFHLLACLPASWKGDVEAEREWFARAWVEITDGTEDQYLVHRFGRGNVTGWGNRKAGWQVMESWQQVAGYCGKYVGKVVDVPNESEWTKAGRWWGKVNFDLLPVRLETHTFTEAQSILLQRTARRLTIAKARSRGFKVEINHEWTALGDVSFATRKALRRSGCKLKRWKPWIAGGMGGRLYLVESESMKLCHFALGTFLDGVGKVLNPPIPF